MIEPEAVMFRHLSSFNWKGTCEGQCEACKAGPEPDFQNSVLPVVDAVCELMRDYMVHAVGSAFTGLANKPANQGHIRKDQHVDDAPTSCSQTLDEKSLSGGSKAMFRTIRNNFSCSLLTISNNFSCSLLYWGLRIVGLLSGFFGSVIFGFGCWQLHSSPPAKHPGANMCQEYYDLHY